MDSLVDNALENVEEDELSEMDELSFSEATPTGGVSDDKLRELLKERTTNITVFGCGGGGSNTATRMVEEGIDGAKIIAANTDVQHLIETSVEHKILLGENETQGRGAGSRPQVGEKSALESEQDIEDAVTGSDMVFVTCGLGGGTGTGSAPVVSRIAREAGALTIAVVTLPFTAEGEIRAVNAKAGLRKLREEADTVIVVPNDKLLESVGNLPVKQAFKVADEVLMRSVKGITQLITESGLVNLDFADVETVMENGGVALIGLGDASGERRAEDSVKKALRSPILDVDISNAKSVLVNVSGGEDMTIEEAEGVVDYVYDLVSDDARIIWGTSVNPELDDTIQTMLVVTGVESPQIFGNVPVDDPEPEERDPRHIDYMVD